MIITTIGDEIAETLEEQIKILKELEIKHIEIRKINNKYLWEYSNKELDEMKNKLKDNNIKVIAIDTPIGKKDNSFNYDKNMQLLNKYVIIAKIFEAKYLRIFSNIGKDSTTKSIKQSLEEMKEIISEYNIELLIENEKETMTESVDQCYEIVKKNEQVNILFDIENSYAKGYNILDEYEKNKEKIKYLHVRDYDSQNKKYTYIGKGTIPLSELFKRMKRDCFSGIISLETMLPKYNKSISKKELFVNSYICFEKIFKEE